MTYQNILIAYDGSWESSKTLLECGELAHLMGAELHLLAVIQSKAGLYLAEELVSGPVVEQERQKCEKILQTGTEILQARGFDVSGHIACGEPVEEIAEKARQLKSDLIIVGHKQAKGFGSRWWKGAVSTTLMDRAPCSILIILDSPDKMD